MNLIDRLKELSGQTSTQPVIDQMRADLKRINEDYEAAIEAVKSGKQIDEGFFSSVKAALQTAGQVGKAGAVAVKDKVKKASAETKELYKQNKSKNELKELFQKMKELAMKFDETYNSCQGIIKSDKALNKDMDYFRRVFNATIRTMSSRKALMDGLEDTAEIEKMLIEEGVLEYSMDMLKPLPDPEPKE